jgi:hypothetical protein
MRWTIADVVRDIPFGSQLYRRNAGFTLVAVFTLALGISATTAIFSVFYGLLINAFPYRDSLGQL